MTEAAAPDIRTRLIAQRGLLDRTSRAERVAEIVRDLIIGGTFRPGTRLSEPEICEALDVSRNTLRESFRILVKDRLVSHELNRGMFVRVPTSADVTEHYTCRRIVEGAAVRGLDPKLTNLGPVFQALDDAENRAADADWRGVGTADISFHKAIVGLHNSARVTEFMEGTWAELRLVFLVMGDPRDFHSPYLLRNGQIAESLRAGDSAKSEQLLAEYLDDAEREVLLAYAIRIATPRSELQ